MNKEKEYKICVVGAGQWGMNHINTLKNMNSLGGIVEKNEVVTDKLKLNYPNCKIYNELEPALKDNFDGFIVATPPAMHFEDARKIIGAKFHLLIEKPITLNKDDAIILNELAKKNNVNLMVGHLLLFHPAFNEMKKILDSGKLGYLQYIYSNRLNHGTIRSEENVFWSLAPHDIALFQYFFDEIPLKITSRGVDILQNKIHNSDFY